MRDTKERILTESLKLFAKKGFDAVSVRDIAAELSISQAALYKHYKSKRDIFDNILKKMEKNDIDIASESGMPVIEPKGGKNVELGLIKTYSFRMFLYWTQDVFASDFRKMLKIEQYKTEDGCSLYNRYLLGGVLKYVEGLFCGSVANYREEAVKFYAPIYMGMDLYDGADDKEEIVNLVKNHIENYCFGEK